MRDRRLPLDRKRILEAVRSALEKHPSILFAYVFGSFAARDAYRDIDVGIFVRPEQLEPTLKLELGLEREIQEATRIPADVRILNRSPLGFRYSVLKDGVLVLDRDEAMRVDFEGLTYKKYFDLRRLRKEYLREILDAPV